MKKLAPISSIHAIFLVMPKRWSTASRNNKCSYMNEDDHRNKSANEIRYCPPIQCYRDTYVCIHHVPSTSYTPPPPSPSFPPPPVFCRWYWEQIQCPTIVRTSINPISNLKNCCIISEVTDKVVRQCYFVESNEIITKFPQDLWWSGSNDLRSGYNLQFSQYFCLNIECMAKFGGNRITRSVIPCRTGNTKRKV